MIPDANTNKTTMLDVGDGHQLWVHDWGNPKSSNPIIFLHGGPGGNVSNKHTLSFNPEKHRVIFFDQRGCGQSLPFGSLQHNDTWKLVEDINKIADHFRLDKFSITGGSWGSCLALIYAIKHPKKVKSLVLTGIFTGTKEEIDWLSGGGFRKFFPDAWQKFIDSAPTSNQDEPAKYHFERVLSDDLEEAADSGRAISDMELSIMSLDDRYLPFNPEGFDPSHARMETHYMTNNCFLDDNYVMNNVDKLTMPIWLVQGRYDMVCPPITAWTLHNALPNSNLHFTLANHDFPRSTYDVYSMILNNLES